MRVSAIFVFAASAMLTPGVTAADPAQPASTTAASPVTATSPPNAAPAMNQRGTAPVSRTTRPLRPAAETVIVDGRAQNDDMLDRIVCRPEPPRTGSRLGGESECHTIREWNDFQKASQSAFDNIQIRALSGGYGR
jgi:hypothetical protein